MLDVYLASLGGLALAVGLMSRRIRDLPLSEPLAALALGVLLGPAVLGVVEVDDASRDEVLATAARLVLAVSLMAVALRYPLSDVRAQAGPVAVLVTVGMAAMAAACAGLSAALLTLPLGGAWLLGSILAPTDPVLASNVVDGEPAQRDLPLRLRVVLSIESAVNDGLALPLVTVGLVLAAGAPAWPGAAGGVARVVVAVLLGTAIGHVSGRLLNFAHRHHDLEQSGFLAATLSLAMFVLGAAELAGGEGILAVFVAGCAYNQVISQQERSQEWEVQEAVNRYLVLPVFTLFGAALPWALWVELGWRGGAFVVGVLLLRRLPLLLALARPLRLSTDDAVLSGWFGPIGVAALFYLAQAGAAGVATDRLWAAGSLVVAASTLAHGLSATPVRMWYARRAQRQRGRVGR